MGFKPKAKEKAEDDVVGKRAEEARARGTPVAKTAGEPECVLYEGKRYRAQSFFDQFRRYYAAREDYGPFDVDTFPDSLTFGMLSPCNYKMGTLWRGKVNKCVRHAIAFAKKEKKMELEGPEIVRANWEIRGGFVFYITFNAMDKKSGVRQLYEAKVLIKSEHILHRKPKPDDTGPSYVRLIRVKNQKVMIT